MTERDETPGQSLFKGLWHELFQTETSATIHCRREAERLEGTPPAQAMLAVVEHATRVVRALPELASAEGLPPSRGGSLAGQLFSGVRDKLTDPWLRSERSYRGTLLGMRHGVDVVSALQHSARRLGYTQVVTFCDAWLRTRKQLVEDVEQQLEWFAEQPEQATRFARPFLLAIRRQHAN